MTDVNADGGSDYLPSRLHLWCEDKNMQLLIAVGHNDEVLAIGSSPNSCSDLVHLEINSFVCA